MGIAEAGQYDIRFTKTGYETVTIEDFTLTNGFDAQLNVMMGETGVDYLNASLDNTIDNCTNKTVVIAVNGSGNYNYLWNTCNYEIWFIYVNWQW